MRGTNEPPPFRAGRRLALPLYTGLKQYMLDERRLMKGGG